VSREAASHPSDEAGESRNTHSVPDGDILAFSTADSDSSDESDDDAGSPELLKTIEDEVKSRRAIEEKERSAASDSLNQSNEGGVWTEVPVRKTGKSVVATSIRGIPLLEAYANPFASLVATEPIIDAPVENLLERMHR
jgi:hypothetical protein